MNIDKVRFQVDVSVFKTKQEFLQTIDGLMDQIFQPELWDVLNDENRMSGLDELTITVDRQFVLDNANWIEDDFDEEFTPIITGNTPTNATTD